jgi:hypothetical protein
MLHKTNHRVYCYFTDLFIVHEKWMISEWRDLQLTDNFSRLLTKIIQMLLRYVSESMQNIPYILQAQKWTEESYITYTYAFGTSWLQYSKSELWTYAPWPANLSPASQVIPFILRNPQIHDRVYMCPPSDRTLNQINLNIVRWDNAGVIATRYGLHGPGEYPISYTMGTGSLLGRSGQGLVHPTSSSAEGKERIALSLLG